MKMLLFILLVLAGPLISATQDSSSRDFSEFAGFEARLVSGTKISNASEISELEAALSGDKLGSGKAYGQCLSFLEKHPKSSWKYSLLVALGRNAYQSGRYTRVVELYKKAFDEGKDESDEILYDQVSDAGTELARMYSRVGRLEELTSLMSELDKRHYFGAVARRYEQARMAINEMTNVPGESFRCGPYALASIQASRNSKYKVPKLILDSQSPRTGFSLGEVLDMSVKLGMNFQVAKRHPGARVIVPSVVHWKLGHYAALISGNNNIYKAVDPTFRSTNYISKNVLDEESSGYYLVPVGALPEGWEALSDGPEIRGIYGKGTVGPNDTLPPGCNVPTAKGCPSGCDEGNEDSDKNAGAPQDNGDPSTPGGDSGCTAGCDTNGMPRYNIDLFRVALILVDTPVGYRPPVGPALDLKLTYHSQANIDPHVTLDTSYFGANWGFNWLGSIHVHHGSEHAPIPGDNVTLISRGGGSEDVTNIKGIYSLARANSSGNFSASQNFGTCAAAYDFPVGYERIFPSGWKEVYGLASTPALSCMPAVVCTGGSPCTQSSGWTQGDRDYFLTQLIDPSGNAVTISYNNYRLDKITDSRGRSLTFGYDMATGRVIRVTDPFGRLAQFEYDSLHRLVAITDTINLKTTFTYNVQIGDFISAMNTPYGTTKFSYCTNCPEGSSAQRRLDILDPEGNRERAEFNVQITPAISLVPESGMLTTQFYSKFRNTFYWNKNLMHENGGQYTEAFVYHWLHQVDAHDPNGYVQSTLLESVRYPLQSALFFNYPGQVNPSLDTGITMYRPSKAGRKITQESGGYIDKIWHFDRDAEGRLVHFSDPKGHSFNYAYAPGNSVDLQSVKDGAGETLAEFMSYNSQHKPTQIVDPSGGVTEYTYSSQGQVTSVKKPSGLKTIFVYDLDGFLTKILPPTPGSQVSLTYDEMQRVASSTDSVNGTINFGYDNGDRLTSVNYPDGSSELTTYDKLDVASTTDRLNRKTSYTYDHVRRMTSMKDPMNRVTGFEWCACGALSSLYDGKGNQTHWEHDSRGRIISKTYADGKSVTYDYNLTDNRRVKRIDAKGQMTNYSYDLDNKLLAINYSAASTPSVTFQYELILGRLTQMTDGTGVTNYTYYPISSGILGAGRLQSVDGPLLNDTISYSFDQDGRLTSRDIYGTAENYNYNQSTGQLVQVSNPLGTFDYSYDAATPRLSKVHYPNGQEARYDYFDSLISGRLKQIKNVLPNSSVLSQFDYTYNPAGEITRWTQLQNGATTTWDMSAPDAYDADSELHKALQITTAGTTPFQWDYDKAGNRTTEFIGTASTTWATNNLNQLTSQNANAAILEGDTNRAVTGVTVNQTPVPTLGGNQFQTQIPLTAGANTVAIQASAADGAVTTNRYQIDNPATLGYDLAGNLTSTGSQILDYDAEQRLVQITDKKTSPATVTTMQYDGMWRRVGIKTTQGTAILGDKWYVWNDFSIAEERDASGQVIKKRYFGNGMRIEGATNVAGNYFYTKDKLQSIRGTIDSTGIVRNSFDYDSWGRRTKIFGDVDIDFGYTGNFEATNTNLSFAVFRAYAPELGRWLNRDPLESKDGVSPYLYVKNDPIGRRDPSGLKADEASVLEYVIKNKIPKDCSDRSKCFNDALESFHTCTKIAAAGTAGCLVGAALGCLAIPGYVECLGPALVICSEAGSAGAAACGVKLAVDFATCTQKQ